MQWLGESPDATAIGAPATAGPPATPSPTPAVTSTDTRPRKAERRAARRAAFYADRRQRAVHSPRALFEVAADQVRALDDDRALTAAVKALDQVIARYGS